MILESPVLTYVAGLAGVLRRAGAVAAVVTDAAVQTRSWARAHLAVSTLVAVRTQTGESAALHATLAAVVTPALAVLICNTRGNSTVYTVNITQWDPSRLLPV